MTAVKPSAEQQEWNIKSCTGACSKCEKNFEENQDFFTRLGYSVDEENPGFLRADYCLACWNDKLKQGAISSWKTFYKPPPPPKQEAMKKETAESALRGLLEKNKPRDANLIFVLAVMLERKKDLVEKEVQKKRGGKRIRVYEHKTSGDTFLVTDPELKLDELEKVQTEVAELLGWNQGRLSHEEVDLEAFLLCGKNLRTRYKYEKGSRTARIPGFWDEVKDDDLAARIPAAVNGEGWHALYHRFESEYRGAYTLTIGLPVTEAEKIPDGLEAVAIPAQRYYKFVIEGATPEMAADTWPKIWKYFSKIKDVARAYRADFEKYVDENTLEIYVSVKPVTPEKPA